jgi:hypothetical protein
LPEISERKQDGATEHSLSTKRSYGDDDAIFGKSLKEANNISNSVNPISRLDKFEQLCVIISNRGFGGS